MVMQTVFLVAKMVGANTPAQEFFYTVCSYIVIGILALGAFAAFIALPLAILVYIIKWGKYIFEDHTDDAIKELRKAARKFKG